MPVGLDGNPEPVVTAARDQVLSIAARAVMSTAESSERTLVAIDGRSGAGKSTFANELASRIARAGLRTLRSTTDSFHRPRSERMRLGPSSPEGYYLESHQLDVIVGELLEPFARGESEVLLAAFDEPSDTASRETAVVHEPTALIFDGLFLQRPEFERFWDQVIFLTADARVDARWMEFLLSDLPSNPTESAAEIDERLHRARWPRYRHGWSLYAATVQPLGRASIVIDNNDFANPQIRNF
ncbi:MAG: hypothetical protein M3Z84_04440 [Actinomycetota bacterium]|nr:hypothetical protein [Actinomycetota bacterium]